MKFQVGDIISPKDAAKPYCIIEDVNFSLYSYVVVILSIKNRSNSRTNASIKHIDENFILITDIFRGISPNE